MDQLVQFLVGLVRRFGVRSLLASGLLLGLLGVAATIFGVPVSPIKWWTILPVWLAVSATLEGFNALVKWGLKMEAVARINELDGALGRANQKLIGAGLPPEWTGHAAPPAAQGIDMHEDA